MVFEGFVNPEALDRFRKCCKNCTFSKESELEFPEGLCVKNVANTLCGQYIENVDTFYCSYYRFINSLGSDNE